MIIYLIKSGLCLLMLFGLYHFVLGREKMYRFNRYYLLMSLVFGLLIPLHTIQNETTPLNESILFKTEEPKFILKPTGSDPDITQYLIIENSILAIYFAVTVVLLIRFAMNLFSMLTKIRQNKKIAFDNYTLVLTNEKTLPYTFLSYIFINEEDFSHGRIEPEILEHEKAHAKQLHTFDIVFIELLQLFFWFQPALYGFKKALRFNHEFLADEAVLKKEVPTENYQNLILAKITNRKPVPFSSNLAYLVTKKRFLMMTKQTSTLKSSLLKLAVIPLIAVLTVSFSTYEETEILPTTVAHTNIPIATAENEPQNQEIADAEYFAGVRLNVYERRVKTNHGNPLKNLFFSKTYEELTENDFQRYGKIFKLIRQNARDRKSSSESKFPNDKIEIVQSAPSERKTDLPAVQETRNPDFPGGIGEFMKYFAANFNYPKDLKTTEVLRLVASFDVTKEGAVDNIKILKGHSKEVDQEVIRVLKASPKWIPGEKDGKKIDAQLTLPIQLQPR